ncbi:MAG: amidase [Pseudomonadales bacterium]|nr:amidase [Pseudomonadales bacterium]NIX09426.1 amidase [Pseudomonadales bacterium]
MSDLTRLPATKLVEAIRRGDASAVEVMDAHYDRIEARNPEINALVNVLPREAAHDLARQADAARSRGEVCGPLHGLPMAVKDTHDAAGFPTTWGFVPWAERVAQLDGELAARQRRAGALIIAKSNVPEFALGSHTFNRLFGTTSNPYDPSKTAGGSSGGAAAALATGMLPLADGSDMGGSLRNPAGYCNVVGLRPSVGRVPGESPFGWFARLLTPGPMARNVDDVALLLSVQAGPRRGDPLSRPEQGECFREPPHPDRESLKIAWSADLGFAPVDAGVARLVEQAAVTFEQLGCRVENDCPDLRGGMSVFQIQRAANLGQTGRALDRALPGWRDHAKDTMIWNVEQGYALTAEALIRSEVDRTAIYQRVSRFFADYDALLLPSAQVPAFDKSLDWVREINGQAMETYIDWMTICCAVTVTDLPSISVPAGFTPGGLPIGLQIVGRPHGDLDLLAIARLFEEATGHRHRHPLQSEESD